MAGIRICEGSTCSDAVYQADLAYPLPASYSLVKATVLLNGCWNRLPWRRLHSNRTMPAQLASFVARLLCVCPHVSGSHGRLSLPPHVASRHAHAPGRCQQRPPNSASPCMPAPSIVLFSACARKTNRCQKLFNFNPTASCSPRWTGFFY